MTIYKALTTAVLSLALLVGSFSLVPSPALAFNPLNPLDPFCLFSCDERPVNNTTTYNTTSGSYNTNSFNTNTNTGSTYVAPATYTGSTYVAPPAYIPAVYTPTVYTAPAYTPTPVYQYQTYQPSPASPISLSCYPTPTTANIGTSVTWGSSVSGGNGSYHITWSGTDSLSGNGSQIMKTYSTQGSKNASIIVTSGGLTASANCSGTINVYDNTPVYQAPTPVYQYPPAYIPQVYYPPAQTYYPVSVSCSANTTYTTTGSYVTWTAYVSGGNTYNTTYSWSGTDNLYGSQSAVSTYYNNAGTKYAYVNVYSNGQNATAQCTNSVTVASNYQTYNQPVYGTTYGTNYGTNSNLGLQIACAVDKVSATVGTPVTWTVEAIGSGGYTTYTYAWTGSDGLSGNQPAIIKSYSTAGLKSAVVTVTAPNGQSMSKACTNTITIKNATVAIAKNPVVATATHTPTPQVVYLPAPQVSQAAAPGLFSLQNVPWGWVAVLVILVLLGMVFYMLFNKKQI